MRFFIQILIMWQFTTKAVCSVNIVVVIHIQWYRYYIGSNSLTMMFQLYRRVFNYEKRRENLFFWQRCHGSLSIYHIKHARRRKLLTMMIQSYCWHVQMWEEKWEFCWQWCLGALSVTYNSDEKDIAGCMKNDDACPPQPCWIMRSHILALQ